MQNDADGIAAITVFAAGILALGNAAHAQQAGIDAGLLVKANGGDAAAQVAVGESYEAGTGVPKDLQQAATWYQKAADKNNMSGELHIAALYRDGGKGFTRDMAQAATWFQKAADQGDVEAEATMGTLYSMGQGVQQELRRSLLLVRPGGGGEGSEAGDVCGASTDDGRAYYRG